MTSLFSSIDLDIISIDKKFNNKVQHWLGQFDLVASGRAYTSLKLGDAFGHPIQLFYSQNKNKARKKISLTSLFHGDEIASMVALYELLNEGLLNQNDDLAISFIPIVNPTGFELNQRMNKLDENPNRGFDIGETKASVEGDILLKNSDLLFDLAKDGFLSLHEDCDVKDGIYVYTYEDDLNAPLGKSFLEINKDIMLPLNGNIIMNAEKAYKEDLIVDGLVLNEFGDGTYEELLVINKQTAIAAVTETPSHSDVPFETRVKLNKNYIKAFIDFVS